MNQKLSNQQKGSLLAFIGVFLITPDSLLIRLSNIETWGMLFYRGAIPFTVVLIGTLIFYNKNFLKKLFGIGYPGIFYIFSFGGVEGSKCYVVSFIFNSISCQFDRVMTGNSYNFISN